MLELAVGPDSPVAPIDETALPGCTEVKQLDERIRRPASGTLLTRLSPDDKLGS